VHTLYAQNDVNTKYISIKMDPKGRMPPRMTMTHDSKYHFFSGMARGIGLTRHGKSGLPDQLRPTTVPRSVSGKMRKNQMLMIATSVPKWMARDDS